MVLLAAGVSFAESEAPAQQPEPPRPAQAACGAAQSQPGTPLPSESDGSGLPQALNACDQKTGQQPPPVSEQQPKRILGVMPNYRAVSAGEIPPPPTPKEAFKIATQNSFDYSAFVFAGVTSLMAEGTNTHPQLGKGVAGFGRYYWRGFVDKADGNYLVLFALPTVFHQDERYYAKGKGGFWNRAIYAASSIFVTPDYHGHPSFNASELFGRGLSQALSATYYPRPDRTPSALAVKFGYAVGRDALVNVIREFWPDIATHVLHRHP